MSAYSDLRNAITREVAHYAAAGATLAWAGNSRMAEVIIRRGESERRVTVSKTPTRYDKASAIGRVRRALREVGVQDVATPAVRTPKPKPKRPTQGERIKALEATVAGLLARVETLENLLEIQKQKSPPRLAPGGR